MLPGNDSPSLRERVNAALDHLTWEQRTVALVTLLEGHGHEQARIGYQQGRESAEIVTRDHAEWTRNETWREARAELSDALTTRCLDAMRAGDPEKVANGLAQAAEWIRNGKL